MPLSRRLSTFVACAALSLSVAAVSAQNATHLVISQVYGGGGATTGTPTYNTDYVELFNPTNAAISTSGLSVQYGSATSTANYSGIATLPAATILPGHYYLVGGSGGSTSTGGTLPTADYASGSSLTMSATAGRVALVQGTTGVACSSTAIIDKVGYGAVTGSSSCYETAATATLSATTSATRTSPCTDGNNNSTDFGVVTPVAHNSTSSSPSCFAGSAALTVTSATANPSSVSQGAPTTFTVVVSPAANSGSLTVTANLTAIGGSATQALTLTGTNTYTFTYTVPSSTAVNTYSLPVTATDATSATANGTITLGVAAPATITPISALQGNRSTYVGTNVTTQGVVTALTSAGWYMQMPGTPAAGQGLYVYAGSGKIPTGLVAGSLVTVGGTLDMYPLTTASHAPALELDSPTVSSISTGTIPAPIVLPAGFPATGATLTALQGYESMLVTFPSLTSVSGTGGSLTESTETVTSTGVFYATATGVTRPFQEPGIDFRDFPYATCPTFANCTSTATTAGVARPSAAVLFDDDDERILVDSDYLNGNSPLNISAGAVMPSVTGIIDYSYSSDSYYDPARFLPTSTITRYTPGITVQAVPAGAAGQATIAAYNIERFYNTNAADDIDFYPVTGKTEKSSAVDVTQAAYTRRLQKVSLAIRTVLNSPDVVSLEEAENLSVVQDIAAQIKADGGPDYAAYGTDNVTTYTNDVSGISVGFLAKKSTVDVKSWGQINPNQLFTNSSGNQETVNDRPSQVLKVGIMQNGSTVGEYPLTIIANHLKALTGVDDLAPDTRTKKELQAEMLATAIQGYQTNGEHVIAMGDFNAFEFSDGYTDTLGTVTGRLSPAGTSVQPGMAITNPAATDMALTLPASQRQSYNEDGEAEILDHIVVTSDLVGASTLQYAHLNADFPLISTNDATTPARNSDHDAAVLYVTLPAPATDSVVVPAQQFTPGAATTTLSATVNYTGAQPTASVSFAVDGSNPQNAPCKNATVTSLSCAIDYPTASLTATTHTLTVTVLADSNYAAMSGTGSLTPGSSKPAVKLTVQNATIAAGTASATITVSGTFTNGVIPMGTTSVVIDGASANAACSLTSYSSAVCQANLPTGSLAKGTHTITAYNAGDANYSTGSGTGVLTVQ